MKIEKVKISQVKPNPDNPRVIQDADFDRLVKSIEDFPEMLEIRPIVVDNEGMVLGGNQRLKACKKAGLNEVFIIRASELTEEQRDKFIIRDNGRWGAWDYDLLKDWNPEELELSGVELPVDKICIDGESKEIDCNYEPATELGIEKEYVVIVFNNKEEHEEAIDKLGLKIQREVNNKKLKLNNVGIQRVMKYEDLRSIIK